MSYARSPRPLCSITIGIRPSPFGCSIVRLLRLFAPAGSAGPARAHHGVETRRLVGNGRAREDPVDHVLLQHRRLEITEALGFFVMPGRRLLDEVLIAQLRAQTVLLFDQLFFLFD